jgi:hypothetical protein
MSLLLPRRRLGRLAIYFVSISLVLIAADLILVQLCDEIQPGYETTRINSPALPDGSVDYLMAIEDAYGKDVTPENNAAPLIIQAAGRVALAKTQPPDGITDRLGMAHLPDEGDYFVTYEAYCKNHSISTNSPDFDPDAPLNWPPTIDPLVVQWVNANEKPLNLIVQASKRSHFFLPWYGGVRPDTLAEILLPYLGTLRGASRALLARSVIRIEAGDVTGFEQDVLAVHHLARLVDQSPTLIEDLVAMGPMEGSACHIDRLAAASGKLSAEQASNLAGQLSSLSEMKPYIVDVDRGERYMTIELMQSIARAAPDLRSRLVNDLLHVFDNSSGLGLQLPEFVARIWPIRCEYAMKTLNQFYDGLVAAAAQPTYETRMSALKFWDVQVEKLRKEPQIVSFLSADWPAAFLLPTLDRLEQRSTTTRMERRIAVIALMLAAYKADHGVYPDRLDLLPVDSDDLFVDRPLTYAPHQNGYDLHSAGLDLLADRAVHDDFAAIFPQMK